MYLKSNTAENEFDYLIRTLAVASITEFFTTVENDDLSLKIGIMLSSSPDHVHQSMGIYRFNFFPREPSAGWCVHVH